MANENAEAQKKETSEGNVNKVHIPAGKKLGDAQAFCSKHGNITHAVGYHEYIRIEEPAEGSKEPRLRRIPDMYCKICYAEWIRKNVQDGVFGKVTAVPIFEVDMDALEKMAVKKYDARHNIQGYVMPDGKTLFTIAEGRLVNLAAGDGHPAEIMDMSFAIQALSAEYLAKNRGSMEAGVIPVPREIDKAVAQRKLKAMGVEIDTLSEAQAEYLGI